MPVQGRGFVGWKKERCKGKNKIPIWDFLFYWYISYGGKYLLTFFVPIQYNNQEFFRKFSIISQSLQLFNIMYQLYIFMHICNVKLNKFVFLAFFKNKEYNGAKEVQCDEDNWYS